MTRKNLAGAAAFLILTVFASGSVPDKAEIQRRVRAYRQQNEHGIISEFIELLSIPNVSSDAANIRLNAEHLVRILEKRGLTARVMETDGNPVVVADLDVPEAEQTLLFYVHYDGQPVDEEKWTGSQPFKPILRPGKLAPGTTEPRPIPLPDGGRPFDPDWRLYARSSSDDKAPLIALLTAVDALRASGIPLRSRIKFILDGEEEMGSPNLRAFLEQNAGRLECEALFMCDGPVYYSGDPTLFFGCRGMVSVEITVYGPDTNLHSGHFGNWAPNPALRLVRLLETMKDAQGRVAISGFYETMVPPSEAERRALAAIPDWEEKLRDLYAFSGSDGPGWSLMESLLYPSLNINGLRSGWVGEQARTIIPREATASIDIRLVKGDDPDDMVEKLAAHIRGQGYHIVGEEPDEATRKRYPLLARLSRLEWGYPASRTPMDHPFVRRLIEGLEGYSDRRTILIPSLGGSLPMHMFEEILKVPVVGLPIANHDNNQHQADENIRIGHLWTAIETFAAVLMMDGGGSPKR